MTNLLRNQIGAPLLGASLLLGSASTVHADTAAAPAAAPADATPAAPAFDGWVIKKDSVIPAKSIARIEAKLGGKISGLRNTTYDVSGKSIQVNVIVAANSGEGDKLLTSLTKDKAAWAVARKGNVLYEFVGKNDTTDEIKKAHDKLLAP